MHALDDVVADLVVGGVAPPGQHIGLVQHRFRQAVLRFVKRRRAHCESLIAEMIGDDLVHAIGVDLLHALGGVDQSFSTEAIVRQARLDFGMVKRILMPVLIPYGYANWG